MEEGRYFSRKRGVGFKKKKRNFLLDQIDFSSSHKSLLRPYFDHVRFEHFLENFDPKIVFFRRALPLHFHHILVPEAPL